MKKVLNRATPVSVILNIILFINVVVVLYPVLFTVGSSLTLSSSLAATSIIPFTDEKDVLTSACPDCYGTGRKILKSEKIAVKDIKNVLKDPSLSRTVLTSLTKGDPYKGVDVETGLPFDPEAPHAGATVATVRVASMFTQDEILQDLSKAEDEKSVSANRKLIYTIYHNDGNEASTCNTCGGYGTRACENCSGRDLSKNDKMGNIVNKGRSTGVLSVEVASDGTYVTEICPVCNGSGIQSRLTVSFRFKKPSLYQFRRLLTSADKEVEGSAVAGGKKILGTNYKHWYFNTLVIAILNTIITVFVCTTSGYIFSRFEFVGRRQIMAGMIILQMFPSFIGMVATYVILWKFGALDTLWGLVLVYSAGSIPFNSQLMKGYFDTMSRDIAEAAYIDGASPLGAYLRVILPAARPQLVFLTLTSFTGPWMDYIFPRLILRSDDKKTLAVGLYEMISGRSNDNFTMFAAGAILVAVPFALIFMAGQKSLLMSLAGTSGKE